MSAQRTGDDIVVSVGAAASGGATNATIVLLPYLASRDVAIGRGENAREKVTYTNIVRDIVPHRRMERQRRSRGPSRSIDYKDYDGIVVLLQAGSPEKSRRHPRRRTLAIGSKT